ncbi:1-phosphofructokinase [Asanoa ishikariensis]|uniref:1-phosphofructokinase/tagatose 6-phosphate kinase n=1 Tax=Asanoa ishikariensis TaxID=137265 RepID=A0A1H3UFR5_9ACTN|nr:PfkB family carbohydrate kinase [Asanoa ishikariensis]GIF63615.1 1-phosphofructokinase [Asanoa ishikariensis]SDZ61312.1 1-phosphofructokinase/tagatose 6-phosphate kinase [Asanoa ishikariensis]
MLIATPNLCLDRTQLVPELVLGGVMRARSVEVTAGGKGVNIARVARSHQRKATVVGLVADRDRERLLRLLAEEGADVVDVPMPGDTRNAIIMIEQPGGRTTIVNEQGSTIDADIWERYRDAVAANLPAHLTLSCSGSLPPGAPEDGYGQLVELAHTAGVLAVVDTAPGALRASLASGPDLVKPNLQEAEAAISGTSGLVLTDADGDVRERAMDAAATLCALGARNAAVTAGAHGAALAEGAANRVRWFPAMKVQVVSAVGAGDSFLGGVLLELEANDTPDWAAAILRGSATASASCEQLRAGGVDPNRAAELLAQLRKQPTEPARRLS